MSTAWAKERGLFPLRAGQRAFSHRGDLHAAATHAVSRLEYAVRNVSLRRFRIRRDKPRVRELGERLSAWVVPRSRLIGDAEPVMPEQLGDCQQDTWESLIAVADAVGGDWPSKSRAAVLALTGDAEDVAPPRPRRWRQRES